MQYVFRRHLRDIAPRNMLDGAPCLLCDLILRGLSDVILRHMLRFASAVCLTYFLTVASTLSSTACVKLPPTSRVIQYHNFSVYHSAC